MGWALASATETEAFGTALARSCPRAAEGPRLLFLSGELGAGKTTLAAAVLGALGVTEMVRSPSYSLIETYPIELGLAVHIDCYRLSGGLELEQLGLRDYYHPGTIWLVEWPEKADAALPRPDLWLTLAVLSSGRSSKLEARSDAGREWLARLQALLPHQS